MSMATKTSPAWLPSTLTSLDGSSDRAVARLLNAGHPLGLIVRHFQKKWQGEDLC